MRDGRAPKMQKTQDVTSSKMLVASDLAGLLERIRNSIAHRAYEFYQERRFQDGHDLDDWFRAEEEFCRPRNGKVTQSDREVVVQVPLPGFAAEDVEVGVEPRRLIIWAGSSHPGKADARSESATRSETNSAALLKVLTLPSEVDPPKAVAHFSGDTLTVELPKGTS